MTVPAVHDKVPQNPTRKLIQYLIPEIQEGSRKRLPPGERWGKPERDRLLSVAYGPAAFSVLTVLPVGDWNVAQHANAFLAIVLLHMTDEDWMDSIGFSFTNAELCIKFMGCTCAMPRMLPSLCPVLPDDGMALWF